MTHEEMTELLKLMNESRPKITQTFHFNAPIGQQIAHVDKIEAHFDKDMTMQVYDSPAIAPADNSGVPDTPSGVPDTPSGVPVPSSSELCHFIHPSLDDAAALQLHEELVRLCRRFGIQDICSHLHRLSLEKRLLLPGTNAAYAELQRMGMPGGEGFSYKTFAKYYRK